MSERKMLISKDGIEKIKQTELSHKGHLESLEDNIEEINGVIKFITEINKDVTKQQIKELEEKLIQLSINVR